MKDIGGREEEDSKPPLVTASTVRISSDTAQEVVQKEATSDASYQPPGWIRTKLEPDWQYSYYYNNDLGPITNNAYLVVVNTVTSFFVSAASS